ncbi:MAG: hypothetical protein JSS02_25555 [Planctomycetes bacterium]|nr:hypothetical protein [Planctomycetota bacterium]
MKIWPALLVFGSAGAGYVYTHPDVARGLEISSWLSEISSDEELGLPDPPKSDPFTSESEATEDQRPVARPRREVVAQLASAKKEDIQVVTGYDVSDFGKIFRFDLTPQVIQQRWTRVSTSLSDEQWQGYRVPLVTGTADNDLAGSLTYYFDHQSKLRRITFLGTTGNPKRFVTYMAKYYGFQQVSGKSEKTQVYRVQSRFKGEINVTPGEGGGLATAANQFRLVLSLSK